MDHEEREQAAMQGEIIAIGDELTSGRIINSTSGYAARHLFAAGYDLVAMHTIGDSPAMISEVLQKALQRADFIIVTGGLGATTDDLTNDAVARALGRPATFFPEIFRKISGIETRTPASHPLEKLAWLPRGSQVLHPEGAMAGHLLVHERIPIFFLPGVPEEMQELLTEQVVPYLKRWSAGAGFSVRQRTYKVFGPRETAINEKLKELEKNDPRLRIGYYPVFPEVQVSLTVRDGKEAEAEKLFRRYDGVIRERLGDDLFGLDQDRLELVVGNLLRDRLQTVATAESCTGGLLGHLITTIPGSSAYFIGGVTTYSNALKEQLLGVEPALLDRRGAVSGPVARAMAEGCRRLSRADYGLAVTGIAGPGGGTLEKPVGTVYFGLAGPQGTRDFRFLFKGDRHQIQVITCATALDLLRRHLLGLSIRAGEAGVEK